VELNDAIYHLKESLADPTHKWGCEECKQEHEQLLEWLEDYKQLKDDYADLDNRLRTANTENDELKRMLRLAVEDFETAMLEEKCKVCALEHCDYDEICKWRHHDEAMELLGGAANA
jgi:DNA repair exonuclease SbcCD ATPase subunit